jgi:hypothetical protein
VTQGVDGRKVTDAERSQRELSGRLDTEPSREVEVWSTGPKRFSVSDSIRCTVERHRYVERRSEESGRATRHPRPGLWWEPRGSAPLSTERPRRERRLRDRAICLKSPASASCQWRRLSQVSKHVCPSRGGKRGHVRSPRGEQRGAPVQRDLGRCDSTSGLPDGAVRLKHVYQPERPHVRGAVLIDASPT